MNVLSEFHDSVSIYLDISLVQVSSGACLDLLKAKYGQKARTADKAMNPPIDYFQCVSEQN